MQPEVPTMPHLSAMCKENMTPREWLQYYKNVWTRNLIARTVDVQCDQIAKAKNPDEAVQLDDGQMGPVKVRLEARKILVQDALDLIAAIDALMAIPEDKFSEERWSSKALEVDADMIPKEPEAKPEAGHPCNTKDGKPGTWMPTGENGSLVCMPISPEAPAAPAEGAGV